MTDSYYDIDLLSYKHLFSLDYTSMGFVYLDVMGMRCPWPTRYINI